MASGSRSSRRLSARLATNDSSAPTTPALTPSRASRSKMKLEPPAEGPAETSNSISTVPTPSRLSSEDELSTPPTSNALTPESFGVDANGSKISGLAPPSSLRLEIELPERPPTLTSEAKGKAVATDSAKALAGSKYSLGGKRKYLIEDSDMEDDDEVAGIVMRDLRLAQQLQNEEDKKTIPSAATGTSRSTPYAMSFGGLATMKPELTNADPVLNATRESSSDIEFLAARPIKRQRATAAAAVAGPSSAALPPVNPSFVLASSLAVEEDSELSDVDVDDGVSMGSAMDSDDDAIDQTLDLGQRRAYREVHSQKRAKKDRGRLEDQHPVLNTMWQDLEASAVIKAGRASQPTNITRNLKPFQLEGLAWLIAMEKTQYKGGLLGDEMGLGKTIQAVSLIMSDYPAKKPSLVLVPPVALMQWTSEIASYTNGSLKTFVYHGTNAKSKSMTAKDIKKYDVIMMSYNSLESMFRKQERGFKRKDGVYKQDSIIHSCHFHRVILDEAHSIKTRSTMTAKACFALNADYRWCLSGTPLQNRIGEFFSLLRFLQVEPFANYLCRDCSCSAMEWKTDEDNRCSFCNHGSMRHVSVFNQELLNPIQRYGNTGPGQIAFKKLRTLTDRIMLRRLKKDHTDSMELPVKEINIDRQFFSEIETDFANSIMTDSQRKFTTYVENGVMLNNYANIFGLIMQMRQVADHPDLILKKKSEGSQNVMICCICDEPAEEAIQSKCKHDFCRDCATSYLHAADQPDCPRCHILLSIDLEQPEMEQDEAMVKKSSIINRIRMSNWTSSSKIELLVHNLYRLRSDKASHKSIIFSQFTTMLQLIEWRLRRAGISTVMLDGSMTPAQRQASIEYFKNNVEVEVFLVSLKAGGVALNLTEASRVFIVDPWWNPAAEWQSADRVHRIGQTRPCVVTRLCIEDSVESRMVQLQEKKTRMINSTINSDDAAMESLTPEDLQFLFRGS
ncbi:dna repair protein rad16 [Ophiostoma piceae UAMH 11346]|uniref:Dna repair protein rad16 n=1 Tax=Ophiostoma piceae (strain UAMH 11346) TaxID=1262450 RepID=S3CHI2_OPHP1|nr:dna repair protein rad16 [Ophiostoma piceae UAMH 11346]